MTEPVQKEIVIAVTLEMTYKVPFDKEHYPGDTLEEALDYERNLPEEEMMSLVGEHIMTGCPADLSWVVTAKDVTEEVTPDNG